MSTFSNLTLVIFASILLPGGASADEIDDLQQAKSDMESGNYNKAINTLRPMAHGGNADAQKELGKAYEFGQGVKPDLNKATKWYAAAHDANVGTKLSVHLTYIGAKVPTKRKELKRFVTAMQEQAEQGEPDAQRILANLYFKGLGVDRDYAEAKKWYESAASKDDRGAINNLGYMYMHGAGTKQDYKKAIYYFQKGVDLGGPDAMNNLGFMYARGLGTEANYKKAADLFKSAYKLGSLNAGCNLGWLYQNGDGVPQDYQKAYQLYTEAANAHIHAAQYNLGYMHQFGYGVPRDNKKASKYYLSAASESTPDVQDALGFLYGRKTNTLKSQAQLNDTMKDETRAFIHWDLLEVPD